jgi:hypothetical protein
MSNKVKSKIRGIILETRHAPPTTIARANAVLDSSIEGVLREVDVRLGEIDK